MVAPVVIDLGLADAPRESIRVLVDACTQASAVTQCYLVHDAPEGPYAAIAIVTWEADHRIRVEVGLRHTGGSEWRSRELRFQPADAETERYRSVGFVIGTLASARDPERTEPPPAASEAPPASVAPRAESPVPGPSERLPAPRDEKPLRGWVSVVAVAGRAFSEGAPRIGGSFRVGVRVASGFSVMVSAGASSRPRDEQGLLLNWIDAGLGLGFALGPATSSRLELRLDALVERLSAEARSMAEVDTAGRTQPAMRLGVDGVWQLAPSFGLVLGAEMLARPAVTRFRVRGAEVGAAGPFEVGGSLGGRLDL
jgi:hypothetical protein